MFDGFEIFGHLLHFFFFTCIPNGLREMGWPV